MVEYQAGESFVQIVYAKVQSNGKTVLVPIKLHLDGELAEANPALFSALAGGNPDQNLIGNRYQIERILGQGGFGRTYLALDRHRFEEPCVVKEFVPQSQGEYEIKKSRELFEREAKILHQIDIPQIPKFLATFEEDGRLFLVQEYIQGQTYSSLLRQRQQRGESFSEVEVIQLLKNLLPIFSYLHDRQILHRDISPDNLMLQEQTQLPTIIDFGIGRSSVVQGIDVSGDVATTSYPPIQKSIVGKIGYAPQEQLWMGQSFPSSDLYSLAVTAIVLLTGKDPQALTNKQSLKWEWTSYVRVNPGFAQILNRMLQDNPAQRYPSAQAVLTDLEQVFAHPHTRAMSPAVLPQPQPQATTISAPTTIAQPPQAMGATLGEMFVQKCERELLTYVGPIAKFLVQDAVSQNSHLTPVALADILTKHIPDPKQAIEFQSRLLHW
jgi:serine/threonine-protein kinase